jgi:hypothetical protein
VDELDMIPAAGETSGPTRPDIAAARPRPPEAPPRRTIAAEWALWGKEAHETGYHVLRCSQGALREKDFSEAITRYSPGQLDHLPQYTVSWIPGANREPEYIALGVHELAPADPQQAGGRSRVDAVGRDIVFVRLFCLRYADLAAHAVTYRNQALGYQDLIQAVAGIQPPAGATEPARVTLPPEPSPIISQGSLRKQAEQVAALLLTGRQVCLLGADDIPVAERLRFVDTVMAMLPYGLRATMSAATWASSTSQELKLRLFFTSGRRAGGRLPGSGRPRAEDFLVEWGHLDEIDITDQAARLYQLWLKDVKREAPAMLADQVDPVRFAAADLRRMVGNLPKDKSVLATLDDLGRNRSAAGLDQEAVREAAKEAAKRLRRYLAGADMPPDPIEAQLKYRRRVCDYGLLADDGRLSPQRKGELYDQLLRVAFGPALSYDGFCEIEQSAGGRLHTSLRSALARFGVSDWLSFILARPPQPGFRSGGVAGDGMPVLPGDPLDEVMRGVARQTLLPRHGATVLEWALRDLSSSLGRPGTPLAEREYLQSAYEYVYRDDLDTQVRQLRRVLGVAYGDKLGKAEIEKIFGQLTSRPTPALERAVASLTAARHREFVRRQAYRAHLRAQGVPDWATYPKREPRWRRWLPWHWTRRHRASAAPPNDGASFQGSQWEHPRIVILAAIVILAFLVTCFVLVLSLIQHL